MAEDKRGRVCCSKLRSAAAGAPNANAHSRRRRGGFDLHILDRFCSSASALVERADGDAACKLRNEGRIERGDAGLEVDGTANAYLLLCFLDLEGNEEALSCLRNHIRSARGPPTCTSAKACLEIEAANHQVAIASTRSGS